MVTRSLQKLAQELGNPQPPQASVIPPSPASREEESVLVFARGKEIYRVGEWEPELLATRPLGVNALCVHANRLYDAGAYNEIYETLKDRVIAERPAETWALCVHGGELYDAGELGTIYSTLSNQRLGLRPLGDGIGALCSHEGKLYAAAKLGIYELETQVLTARRWRVYAILSHNGNLYDAGYTGVYNTLEGSAVCSMDRFRGLCSYKGELVSISPKGIIRLSLSEKGISLLGQGEGASAVVSVPTSALG